MNCPYFVEWRSQLAPHLSRLDLRRRELLVPALPILVGAVDAATLLREQLREVLLQLVDLLRESVDLAVFVDLDVSVSMSFRSLSGVP
jgi:hypothetical protein